MSLAFATLVVMAFGFLLHRMRVFESARDAITRAGDSLAVLRDTAMGDDVKETALRRNAGSLLWLAATITVLGALALVLPLGVVWLLDLAGLASLTEVLGILQRVDFLLGVSVLGVAAHFIIRIVARE